MSNHRMPRKTSMLTRTITAGAITGGMALGLLAGVGTPLANAKPPRSHHSATVKVRNGNVHQTSNNSGNINNPQENSGSAVSSADGRNASSGATTGNSSDNWATGNTANRNGNGNSTSFTAANSEGSRNSATSSQQWQRQPDVSKFGHSSTTPRGTRAGRSPLRAAGTPTAVPPLAIRATTKLAATSPTETAMATPLTSALAATMADITDWM